MGFSAALAAASSDRSEFVKVDGEVAQVTWHTDPNGKNFSSLAVQSDFGYHGILLDSASNSIVDQIEKDDLRVEREFADNKLLKITVRRRTHDLVDIAEFVPNKRAELIINKIERVRYRRLFLEDPAANGINCNVKTDSSTTTALAGVVAATDKAIDDQIKKSVVDKSCKKFESKIASAFATIAKAGKSETPSYGSCVRKLLEGHEDKLQAFDKVVNSYATKGKAKLTITCSAELPDSKLAALAQASTEVQLSPSWLEKNPAQTDVNRALLHEVVHSSDIAGEDITDQMTDCCAGDFSEKKASCQNMMKLSRKASPTVTSAPLGFAGKTPDGQTGGIPANKEKKVVDGSQSPLPEEKHHDHASGLHDHAPGPQETTAKGPSSPTEKAPTRDSSTELPTTPPLPPVRPADMNKPGAPEAVAQRSHAVIRAGIASATDAIKQIDFDKIAASTVGVPQAQAADGAPGASTRAAPKLDANGNQILFQSRAVGRNPDGSSKIQLPDGRLLPAFQAFGGMKPPDSQSPITQASNPQSSKLASQSVSASVPSVTRSSFAPTASRRPSASVMGSSSSLIGSDVTSTDGARSAPQFARPAVQRAQPARVSASSVGAASSSTSMPTSGPARSSSRAAAPAQSASSGDALLTVDQLQPRSQSVEELAVVPVKTWSDVKTLIRSAKSPEDLVKQKWFLEYLQRDDIRAQVINHGVSYGSNDPRVRFDLKFLSSP